MTRFARIHRNRSSGTFSKVPEEATSWAEFKMQMKMREFDESEKSPKKVKKNDVKSWSEFKSKRNSIIDQVVDDSKKSALKKIPVNISSSWCEFETTSKMEKKNNEEITKKRKNVNFESENLEETMENLKEEPNLKKKKIKKRNDDDEYEQRKEQDTKISKSNENGKNGDDQCEHNGENDDDQSEQKKERDKKMRKNNKRRRNDDDQCEHNGNNDDDQSEQRKNLDRCERNLHKQNKTVNNDFTVVVDGVQEKVTKFDGFYILQTDANRIQELKEKMIKQNRPHAVIDAVIRRHRRNAEKFLSRKKKKLCFHCREGVHVLSECPKLDSSAGDTPAASGAGVCYKCGSTEHNLYQCKEPGNVLKFAKCFICKETGHLSKNCPDNPRGLYPHGGSCRICGDVTHLKRDCPELIKKKRDNTITVGTISESIEGLEDDYNTSKSDSIVINQKRPNKIKFY